MSEIIYYTYGIINVKTKRMYIGSRQCKINPIDDIGHKYFSSSTDEKFMKEQKEHPENFRYRVLKLFENRHNAYLHEIFLHKKFDVARNPKFYNRAIQTTYGCNITGDSVTSETKKKMSESHKGLKHSEETKQLLSQRKKEYYEKFGTDCQRRENTKETREKISKALKGVYVGEKNSFYGKHHTEENKEKLRQINLGKKHTEENKAKIGKMMSSMVWINKDGKNKRVQKDLLQNFINEGWIQGRIIPKKS